MSLERPIKPLLFFMGLFSCLYSTLNYSAMDFDPYFQQHQLITHQVISHFILSGFITMFAISIFLHMRDRIEEVIHISYFISILGASMMYLQWHLTFGMALFLTGSHACFALLLKALITQSKTFNKYKRRHIFTLQYGTMNLGFIIGYLFAMRSIPTLSPLPLMISALLLSWPAMMRLIPPRFSLTPILLTLLLSVTTYSLLLSHHFATHLPLLILMAGSVCYTFLRYPTIQRRESYALMLSATVLFWICYQPSYNIILLLSQNTSNILSSLLSPLGSIFIILCTPCTLWFQNKYQPSFLTHWLILTISLGLCYFCLLIATAYPSSALLYLALIFRCFSELLITALYYAFISYVVPQKWHSILMVNQLLLGIGAYTLSQFSTHLLSLNKGTTAPFTLTCLIILLLFFAYNCYQTKDYLGELIEPS